MRSYGFHSVVGSWTNKHNNGGIPEKNLLTEPQSEFSMGSISRTISHEMGHVLGLSHSCDDCLMDGSGYGMDENQITTVNEEAAQRANE